MGNTKFHVCYHCKNRSVGCHSMCEMYLQEKKENDEEREQNRRLYARAQREAVVWGHSSLRKTINKNKF